MAVSTSQKELIVALSQLFFYQVLLGPATPYFVGQSRGLQSFAASVFSEIKELPLDQWFLFEVVQAARGRRGAGPLRQSSRVWGG